MRIQITGDRDWKDPDIILSVLSKFSRIPGPHVVVEGEAEGADKQSAWAARELGFEVEPHPARWHRTDPKTGKEYFFKGAGPERNIEMLEAQHPDIVLAFHNSILRSKGTRHMVISSIQRGLRVALTTLDELGAYRTVEINTEARLRPLTLKESSSLLELIMNRYPFLT